MLAEVGIVTEARPLAGLYMPSTNTSTYDRADVAKMSAGQEFRGFNQQKQFGNV